ncbi:MAG: hypothetical protein M1331_01540 [Candidatus Marsarchaeota archaeon]|nr:hypothetical protein [Candidatus Marsarchaeota archaeon]
MKGNNNNNNKNNKLLKEIALEKKRNFEDNLKFVIFRAKWIMRKSNKEWSKRQKIIIDEVYKSNRKQKQ